MQPDKAAGLILVLALHALGLYALMQHRLIPMPKEAATLFVNMIAPLEQKSLHPAPAKPAKVEPPRAPEPHPHLVVEAPAKATEYSLPPPPPVPAPALPVVAAPAVVEAPPAPPPPRPVEPVALTGDLSLACPSRASPAYPALSRRLGEEGRVVLRVELDSEGRVDSARVATSSGFKRLDEAALAAVRGWRCNPPTRDGRSTSAVATQPFQFNLE